MEIENTLLCTMYEDMVLGRAFELCAEALAHQGLVAGSIHLGIGEEAAQVGACRALAPEDYLLPSHRTHVGDLVKGTDPRYLLAEIIGRRTGLCGGRAGSSHFADKSTHNLGVQGIIGAVFPVATGAALTQQRLKSGGIVLAMFGEGASHQGTFHESLNLSALWKLRWSGSVSTISMPWAQPLAAPPPPRMSPTGRVPTTCREWWWMETT